MSHQVLQSVDDTNGSTKRTVQSYQSVWLAHWKRARCNTAEEIFDQNNNASESKELDSADMDDNLTNELEVSKKVKLFGFIITKTFEIVDDRMKRSSKVIENEKMQSPLSKYGQLPNAKQSDKLLAFGQGWFTKMKKCSGTELFPTSEKTETKKSYNDCNSPQKLQNCAHVVEINGKTSDLRHVPPFSGQGKPLTSIDSEAKENPGWVNSSNFTLEDESSTKSGCRRAKRLKLSSSREEISKFSKGMHKSSISSSKPTPRKHHDEDLKKLLLSNAWIQRWLHKKPETLMVCELQSSKLEDFQTQQLPSIAAMALMGKAMTGFQPRDIQKRGPFTIWNTKAF